MKTQNGTIDKLINKIEVLDINNKEKKDIIKLINDLKNKKEKDPNIPKKPKNAYMLFMDDVRKIKDNKKPSTHFPTNRIEDIKTIIKNNEDKRITELSKSCGIFWRNIKDDEKIKYETTYKKSHDKYKKDVEKYKKDHLN